MIRPGEVYLGHIGGAGPRPEIVVSREDLNRGDHLVVVPCTSSRFPERSRLAHNVPFRAGRFGFTRDSVAQGESILTISKLLVDLAAGPAGGPDAPTFRDVIRAVGQVLDSDGEPA